MRSLSVYEWCLTSLVIRETQKHNKMPLQTYKDAQNVKVTVIVMKPAEKWEHLSAATDNEKCYNHYGETAWQFLKGRIIVLPYTCPTPEHKSKRNESSCLHKTFTLIFKMTLLIIAKKTIIFHAVKTIQLQKRMKFLDIPWKSGNLKALC